MEVNSPRSLELKWTKPYQADSIPSSRPASSGGLTSCA